MQAVRLMLTTCLGEEEVYISTKQRCLGHQTIIRTLNIEFNEH